MVNIMTKKSVFSFVAALTTAILTASSAFADDVFAVEMLQETQTTIQQLHKKTLPTVTNAALREKNMVPKQWRAGLAGYTG